MHHRLRLSEAQNNKIKQFFILQQWCQFLPKLKKMSSYYVIEIVQLFSVRQISLAEPRPKGVEALPHCCFFATPAHTKTTVRQENRKNRLHNSPSNQGQFRLPS